jgi:hypothetical protein
MRSSKTARTTLRDPPLNDAGFARRSVIADGHRWQALERLNRSEAIVRVRYDLERAGAVETERVFVADDLRRHPDPLVRARAAK